MADGPSNQAPPADYVISGEQLKSQNWTVDDQYSFSFVTPPKMEARLYITPSFCIDQKKMPNCFHRLMHWLMFGFKWKKIEDE